MENSRTCEVCNVNVHRASKQKQLESKKHLENIKQNEMIIPEWLFKEEQTPIKNKMKKVYNLKTLKQLARENIKMIDKELDNELAKKMINPYFFVDEKLKIGFKIILESHIVNHANSLLNITLYFPDIGIETRYIQKILKEMATIYARLINQKNIESIYCFQLAFLRLMKKINEVMKLKYSLI